MSVRYDIVTLIGNLESESPNRKLAENFASRLLDDLFLRIHEIGPLSIYNEDLEVAPPHEWSEFRASIARSNGVLIVTPEHLRSIPAVLMNALDVGSMPKEANVWADKPIAIAGYLLTPPI